MSRYGPGVACSRRAASDSVNVVHVMASEVAAAVGGRMVGDDVEIDGVSIDSRSVTSGQLFVPIVAARDGHEFVPSAIGSGAVAYLSSAGVVP